MKTVYLYLVIILAAAGCLYLLLNWLKDRRRSRLFALEMPHKWIQHIKNNVAIYHFLPAELQHELLGHINVFLSEKYFTGHAGIEVTDEMRVTIAAQACLLLLNRKTDYFPHLKTILIYPAGFKNPNHQDKPGHNLGESWLRGPVVLSWSDSIHGGKNAKDGSNVVIHEFAHQLDQADGAGDGRPWIDSAHIKTWGKVMSKEFKSLMIKAKLRKPSFFNHYGATNPAEFFAVISEHFYEQPKTFERKHPDLYQELVNFYKIDPASWLN